MTAIIKLQQKAAAIIEAAKYANTDTTVEFHKVHCFANDLEAYDKETLDVYNKLRLDTIASLAIQERVTKTYLDAIV